ncbi:MAG: acyloxyacyl hydrolase [Flavobacteriaceae bacterium]|nr:acyloxyacyl hydrolase [Flavobacteriaceae bacterium]
MDRIKNNLFVLLLSFCFVGFAQHEKNNHFSLQLDYFYGNVIKHKDKISHLAVSFPRGFILNWNKKSENTAAMRRYNYPEYGFSFIYHDFQNSILGEAYALNINYTFYFGKKSKKNIFYLRLGQGIAYNTNPFDFETNNKNISFGSHLLANTTIGFNYRRKITPSIDANAGILLNHYSNGSIKSPNTGLNLFSFNTGLSYNFDHQSPIDYSEVPKEDEEIIEKEPIKINLQFSGGVNSSSNIGGKQFPYYVGTIYADKRINSKSILQVGSEIFFSNYLKELIKFNAIAFPEKGESGDADYKRISLLIGHELDVNNFSILTQVGYYVYYPYDNETRYYERVGVKKYFGDKWFASASIKAHLFLAESIDLGIGIRL